MSREDPQMKIRLPADLKDQIEAASKQSGRSMNAEIVARLEGSFQPASPRAPDITDCMEQLKLKYSRLGVLISELTSIRQYRMQLRMDMRQDGLEVSDAMFDDLNREEENFSAEEKTLRNEIDSLQRLIATKGDERFNLAS